jgi:sRNA-binding protein
VPTPASGGRGGAGTGAAAQAATPHRSAGRFPDGADTDSNCSDFLLQPATITAAPVSAGTTSIKVASIAEFNPGQTLVIGNGADRETAMIAEVGTPGATTAVAAIDAETMTLPVASTAGFTVGQTITLDAGGNREAAVIASIAGGPGGPRITVASALSHAHAAGVEVAGSGITLAAALTRAHGAGTQIATELPTPGRPNAYARRR